MARRLLHAAASLALLVAAVPARADAPPELRGSYLGLHTRSNSNVLEAQNLTEGVTVTRVGENSPAAAAGVKPGDVLLQANGVAIGHPSQLDELVEALPAGSEVRLKLERDQTVVEASARTATLVAPLQPEEETSVDAAPRTWIERRHVGFEFGRPSAERVQALGLNPREGVEVLRLAPKSPLGAAGIAEGDVLLRVEGRSIRDPEALIEFLDHLGTEPKLVWTLRGKDGPPRDLSVPTYKPPWQLQHLSIPLLFSVDRTQQKSSYSLLLGLVSVERYDAGSRLELLWLFDVRTGRWDELLEVEGGSP